MQTTQDAREDLFEGKKILYVHGFASSGQSGTVRTLRLLLPRAQVIAPDLPVHPMEALTLLRDTCQKTHPDVIVGTSMGGMLAELLRGYDRILVNPAFQIADTLVKRGMTGKITFHNPRQDGAVEFMMTKSLIQEFREVSQMCLQEADGDCGQVYGLFGRQDELVDTYDLFKARYAAAIRFDGGHYLNDHAIIRSLIPVLQWIDDRQTGRHRPVLLMDLEDVLMDLRREPLSPQTREVATASFALRRLSQSYEVFVVASALDGEEDLMVQKKRWCDLNLGVAVYNRLIFTCHPELLMGDYYIIPKGKDTGDFLGTIIALGDEKFKSWEDILGYFALLGGQ